MSCEKRPYPDKRAAMTAAAGAMCRRKNRPRQLRGYWCEDCRAWHLTKKDPR